MKGWMEAMHGCRTEQSPAAATLAQFHMGALETEEIVVLIRLKGGRIFIHPSLKVFRL